MSSIYKARSGGGKKSTGHAGETGAFEFIEAELPRSAWVINGFLSDHILNDNYLFRQSKSVEPDYEINIPHFKSTSLKLHPEEIGNVKVKLASKPSIHLQDAVYCPNANYNLVSLKQLRTQLREPLSNPSYKLKKRGDHLYLVDELDDIATQITMRVANRIVLMTKEPSIEQVIDYAVAHQQGTRGARRSI